MMSSILYSLQKVRRELEKFIADLQRNIYKVNDVVFTEKEVQKLGLDYLKRNNKFIGA